MEQGDKSLFVTKELALISPPCYDQNYGFWKIGAEGGGASNDDMYFFSSVCQVGLDSPEDEYSSEPSV
jgi:hypothetical protein